MKRIASCVFACIVAVSLCTAQEALNDPEVRDESSVVQLVAGEAQPDAVSDEDSAATVPNTDVLRALERESYGWAFDKFAAFVQDDTMCDVGTALFEDALRGEAMRDHPDWPLWAVDLALDDARDSYLRNLLFAR